MSLSRNSSKRACRRLALAVVVATAGLGAGCRALVEFVETDTDDADPDAAGAGDDGGEQPVDADDECTSWSYTPQHFAPCEIAQPNGALTLTPGVWSYDTNSGALTDPAFDATFPASALATQAGGPEARLLSADAIIVQAGAVLEVEGVRPLILVSWSTVKVDGIIDVSSRGTTPGSPCDTDIK